jgi:hypothetical protein
MACKYCGADRGEYCGIAFYVYRSGTCPKIAAQAPAPKPVDPVTKTLPPEGPTP